MSYDKQIYDKAEAELSRRRSEAEKAQAVRMAEIEDKIPEIKEIYARLSQTVIEISKLILSRKDGFEQRFDKIKEQNLQGQKLAEKLLTSKGYPADYLETRYFCPECDDRGFVDGKRCSCFTRLLNKYSIERLNESANMPNCDFEHFSLEFYRGKNTASGQDCYDIMLKIYNYCAAYAKDFSKRSPSILMYGKTGLGKTHLSLSIAKATAENGFNVAYGSVLNYLSTIEKEHFGRVPDEENADTMNLLINSELLILDDLGSEFVTPFYESVLYNIINSRINLSLPTIISTNLSQDELQKKYNDRIISRIFGVYNTFCFVGEDIRQIKRLNRLL